MNRSFGKFFKRRSERKILNDLKIAKLLDAGSKATAIIDKSNTFHPLLKNEMR
jgi:hypothetical protein